MQRVDVAIGIASQAAAQPVRQLLHTSALICHELSVYRAERVDNQIKVRVLSLREMPTSQGQGHHRSEQKVLKPYHKIPHVLLL